MGTKRYSIKDVYEKAKLSRGIISSLYNACATTIDFEAIINLCE